jgi:hypothetical protein
MHTQIQIRIGGSLISRLSVERHQGKLVLMVVDSVYGRFPVGGLSLEISRDGQEWVPVTEHELIALLVS